ncbi:MAG: winged helix DNA-binding domain-containing protein [Acidobacteria bacterium]|nr:winged helix DNA-binding domain-containing protein [Acidobacteriota bacterium]
MAEARLRVSLTEEQVSCFRDRRAHLAGPGAASAAEAARAILGAQAQQEGPALFALSLRTKGRPTASALRAQLLDASGRRLVRTWGQRDTLHVFDPADWRIVVSARREWPQSGRRGALPSEPDLAAIRSLFEQASGPLFRSELFAAIPQQFVDEVADHPGVAASGSSAVRFAAARLVWRLALAGDICFAEKRGSKQSYVHRRLWFPDLEWLLEAPEVSATGLARRYLAVHGPASAADLAHFFGSGTNAARSWLEHLSPELVEIDCEARQGLFALREDLDALTETPPGGVSGWPVRLLPKWDTHLMRHADKSWLLPDEDERRLVWRKAADISATVVARGRIVAIWTYRATKKRVLVTVTPLGAWRKTHLPGVKREATALADFLEVPAVEVVAAERSPA